MKFKRQDYALCKEIECENVQTRIKILQDKNGNKIIEKISKIDMRNQVYLANQAKFMKEIHSPYVVQLLEEVVDNENNLQFIYMPYFSNGDLEQYLITHQLEFSTKMKMFIQILLGLKEIHLRLIIHRDLKLKNIFVDDAGNCVIGDLGIASQTDRIATTWVGTVGYQAPQVYDHNGVGYDQKVDMWAMGVIAFQLFNNKLNGQLQFPFAPKEILTELLRGGTLYQWAGIIKKFVQRPLIFNSIELSENLKKLIRKMLTPNPDKRPSFLQIYSEGYLNEYSNIVPHVLTLKAQYKMIKDEKDNILIKEQSFMNLYQKYFLPMRKIYSSHGQKILENVNFDFYLFFYLVMRKINSCYAVIEDKKVGSVGEQLKSLNKIVKTIKEQLMRPLNVHLFQQGKSKIESNEELKSDANFIKLQFIAKQSFFGLRNN